MSTNPAKVGQAYSEKGIIPVRNIRSRQSPEAIPPTATWELLYLITTTP